MIERREQGDLVDQRRDRGGSPRRLGEAKRGCENQQAEYRNGTHPLLVLWQEMFYNLAAGAERR